MRKSGFFFLLTSAFLIKIYFLTKSGDIYVALG